VLRGCLNKEGLKKKKLVDCVKGANEGSLGDRA
jgi:hypothetical protein